MTGDRPTKVFRFAPKPNGFLHLGHAYSAFRNFDLARRYGGRFLLRIENVGDGCTREEWEKFEPAIYEDLAWLGVAWEPGVRRQTEHCDDYIGALSRLDALGVIYPCHCSNDDIDRIVQKRTDWPKDPAGRPLYPGTCRRKPRQPFREALRDSRVRIRLDMAEALKIATARAHWRIRHLTAAPATAYLGAHVSWQECFEGRHPRTTYAMPAEWGDVAIAGNDTISYNLAVVIDDALQGVTDVVRGSDLYRVTSLQRLLQTLLDLPEPIYRHHGIIRAADGQKLSKSLGSRSLRAECATPQLARRLVGFHC
jgi:glutamyl-Q tRNA(Asp) synthetase